MLGSLICPLYVADKGDGFFLLNPNLNYVY